jgi:hypothetical protein
MLHNKKLILDTTFKAIYIPITSNKINKINKLHQYRVGESYEDEIESNEISGYINSGSKQLIQV